MRDVGPALMVLLVIAAVGGIIYVAWLMEKRRREAMARLASKLGYGFSARDGWGIPGRYGQIDLFRRGHSRRARNVINGERDGAAVKIFDYRYTTGSGKNKSTHSRNVMIVEMPEQRFPELFIRRESFFDKVAAAVGFDDIDFESHEFSRKFYVKSRDKRFAYDVVDARAKALASTGSPESQAKDENELVDKLRQLTAVVERYPDLKASRNYLELQKELANTENRIQAARRFFNGNVRDYNNKVEMFPSSVIARATGFRRHDFFEIAELERAVPSVG